jgi:hypothetical protein
VSCTGPPWASPVPLRSRSQGPCPALLHFSTGAHSPGGLFLLKSSVARGAVLLLGFGSGFWADFVAVSVFFVRD